MIENPDGIPNGIDDDCDPTTPDSDYSIVIWSVTDGTTTYTQDNWDNLLPEDGKNYTIELKAVANGATPIELSPQPTVFTITTSLASNEFGSYLNDETGNDTEAPIDTEDDDIVRVDSDTDHKIELSSRDTGGSIRISVSADVVIAGIPTMVTGIIDFPYDSDGDGLPDSWERDKFSGSLGFDGTQDNDNDGLTNYEEYRAKYWGAPLARIDEHFQTIRLA